MSIRFQADADLNFGIVTAVRRREPAIDFASSDESGLRGIGDPEVLERMAIGHRVLVSHDRRTMLNCFRERLASGRSSPGLLVVAQDAPIPPVVETVILLWAAMDPAELLNQARHLPSLSRHVFPR